MMRCAKGIFAKGIWGCTRFPLLRWEKGSETPSCDGEQGLRLPHSSCSDLGNEGASDPFPTARGSLRPFFPPQKGKPVHPKIPLAKLPLAQRMSEAHIGGALSPGGSLQGCGGGGADLAVKLGKKKTMTMTKIPSREAF